jgi:glycerol-3-phosphate acyltransferase PlsY
VTAAGLLSVLLGYLLGSIPFSYLMGRAIGGKDVRREGSGNVGATNVFRVAGKKAGGLAAAGDILKSLLPVLLARLGGLEPGWVAATGAAAILGHCYPVWLRFRGGKGVNSALAVFTVISWPAVFVFAAVWLLLFKITRWVSVASMAATATLPLTLAATGGERAYVLLALWTAAFVVYRHRSNIRNLREGEERKM